MVVTDDLLLAIREGLSTARIKGAADPAEEILAAVQRQVGGQRVYIPAPSKDPRNQEIIKRWRAKVPRREIAKEFGLAESTVSAVIGAFLASPRHKRRRGFGSDDWSL